MRSRKASTLGLANDEVIKGVGRLMLTNAVGGAGGGKTPKT